MTKPELVSAMSEKTGVSKKDAAASIDAFVEIISDVLKHGDKLQLVGFGTFEVSERAARTGRNPQTGEDIKIPAAKIPKFKAGAALKNAVNSGKLFLFCDLQGSLLLPFFGSCKESCQFLYPFFRHQVRFLEESF